MSTPPSRSPATNLRRTGGQKGNTPYRWEARITRARYPSPKGGIRTGGKGGYPIGKALFFLEAGIEHKSRRKLDARALLWLPTLVQFSRNNWVFSSLKPVKSALSDPRQRRRDDSARLFSLSHNTAEATGSSSTTRARKKEKRLIGK